MSTLKVGTAIGGYVVVRNPDGDGGAVLGQGEFGITYCGRQRGRLGRPVAIKEYFPNRLAHRGHDGTITTTTKRARLDFQRGLKEFLEEAEALNRFDHPNIVKVLDFVEAKGTAYIVMEWIAGRTLAERVGSRRSGTLNLLTVDELRPILLPLLGALETIHGAMPQLLHRDIKPSNIIIRDQDGSPVLIDFGAARQVTAAASQRLTTILSDGYAPYEQYVLTDEEMEEEIGDLAGGAADADTFPRQGSPTDIYALGAVCHFALTGKKPPNALKRKFGNVRYEPIESRAEGDPAFLRCIDRALAVEPEHRFASAGEWRNALVSGPVPPPPPPPPPSPPPPPPREPKIWPIVAGTLGAIGIVAAIAVVGGRTTPSANNTAIDPIYEGNMVANEAEAMNDSMNIADNSLNDMVDVNVATDVSNVAENMGGANVTDPGWGNTSAEPAYSTLRLNNVCRRAITAIVRWEDEYGSPRIDKWYLTDAEFQTFGDASRTPIRVSSPTIYLYAWVPGQDLIWEATPSSPGAEFNFEGRPYAMRRMSLSGGGSSPYVLRLTC
jgi:serine/threonine protein kinase